LIDVDDKMKEKIIGIGCIILACLILIGSISGFILGVDIGEKNYENQLGVDFSYFDGYWKNDKNIVNSTVRLGFQDNYRVQIFTNEIGDEFSETSDLLSFSWFYDKTVGFPFKNYVLDFEEPLFGNQTLYRCSIWDDPPIMEIYYDNESMVFYKKVFNYEEYKKANP